MTELDLPGGEAYLSELPPRKQNLLLAARRLLVDRGYDGLSWAQIAREAGEQKSMIGYYFGDKASLVLGLLRLMGHDSTEWMVQQCEDLPQGPARIRTFVEKLRGVTARPASLAFFDILPHAIRDPELREHVAELYDWYRVMALKAFGLDPAPGSPSDPATDAIGWLFVAAVDGILVQRALGPRDYPVDAIYEQLQTAIEILATRAQGERVWTRAS